MSMSRAKWTAFIGLSLAASACAGAPPASLVDARSAYERASESPAKQFAPDQLHAAETFLKTAEQTYKDEGNTPNMRDRAYVAMRKAQLAEAQAGIVEANLEVKQVEERDRVAERRAQAVTTAELQQTRAELESARDVNASQGQQLQEETERRQQAEAAQEKALAALNKIGAVKQEPRGTVLTLSGAVIFASGQSQLLPSARSKLSEVAAALSADQVKSKIVIEGHTDSVGSPEMNQELSLKRATAVRDELVARGVNADRVSVEGYGASRPVADNGSQAGRANNRRVEIVVQPAT
jgi:outer membrane protein OmpA-like peptidoglycan-associated protein